MTTKLREALEPFAAKADTFSKQGDGMVTIQMDFAHFRRARQAIASEDHIDEGVEREAVEDIAAELRAFAVNMRRDDSDARSDDLRFYYEAIEQFAERFERLASLGTASDRPTAGEVEKIARLLVSQRGCSPDTLHQFEPSHEPWPVDETQQGLNWEMKPMTISLTRAWRKRVCDAEQILAALMLHDEEMRRAIDALASAEAHYRMVHDLYGDGSKEAGRAWDLMRRAGDRARAALSSSQPQPDREVE